MTHVSFFQPYDESAGYIEATDIKALEQDEEVCLNIDQGAGMWK